MSDAIINQTSRVEVPRSESSESFSNDLGADRRNMPVWEPIPAIYGGDTVLIGFDAEWQRDGDKNEVLSLQYFACDPDGAITWRGIFYPPKSGCRFKLTWFIERVITDGRKQHKLSRWPKRVYLIGHFSFADLVTFADFETFKSEFDAIRRTYATITQDTVISCWDVDHHKHKVKLVLRDSMLLAPAGMQSLKAVGDLVGINKGELNSGEIENMGALLAQDKSRFEEYALRDPEIAVRYCLRIMALNQELLGEAEIPPTLSSIGVNYLLKMWQDGGIDKHSVLGTEEALVQTWVPSLGRTIKSRQTIPTADRFCHESFVTECYHGGRNEQYFFGASEIGDWIDYDLCGAYTTAMSLIGMPQWNQIRATKDLNEFQPHVLGFARVRFRFPGNTRFPCLPVRTANGLIFPLQGESFCCAPEIYLAQSMAAQIEILHGIVLPADFNVRPFEKFIVECTARRNSFEKKTINELFWKELSNGSYGKTAQGLRRKRVFDARSGQHQDLPPSKITNPFIAAYVTSFVRAALGEILSRLPLHGQVSNATTDGFLATATEAEALAASQGPICLLFAQSRMRICGNVTVLEQKHQVRQVLGWRTRGQATIVPTPGKNPVLAKAGLQAPMRDTAEQNSWIINTFVNRTENTTQTSTRLRTLPEIYKNGGDLVSKEFISRVSMEYDWKRQPIAPTTRPINDVPHLYFDTVPWRTVDEFTECREQWQNFTGSERRVLKSEADLARFNEYRATVSVSGVRKPRSNSALKTAMRMFLRANVRSDWGLDAGVMSYSEIAQWLTKLGYATKKSDLENAARRNARLEAHLVPRTPAVDNFIARIVEKFPAFQSDQLLVPRFVSSADTSHNNLTTITLAPCTTTASRLNLLDPQQPV